MELLCTDPHSMAYCSASLQVLRLSPAAMQTVTFSVASSTTSSAVKTTKGVANEVLTQVRLACCGPSESNAPHSWHAPGAYDDSAQLQALLHALQHMPLTCPVGPHEKLRSNASC